VGSIAERQPFDFIVVGGGTAGNAVAGRLAENPDVRVLVIEAGIGFLLSCLRLCFPANASSNPQDIENVTTPARAFDLRGSQYDRGYKTTMIKREDYERVEKPNTPGKMLGGSSSANYFDWVSEARRHLTNGRSMVGRSGRGTTSLDICTKWVF
jgi:choline dehydrogenase